MDVAQSRSHTRENGPSVYTDYAAVGVITPSHHNLPMDLIKHVDIVELCQVNSVQSRTSATVRGRASNVTTLSPSGNTSAYALLNPTNCARYRRP